MCLCFKLLFVKENINFKLIDFFNRDDKDLKEPLDSEDPQVQRV